MSEDNYHTFFQIEKVSGAKFLNDYFPYPVLDEKNKTVSFSEVFLREKLLFLAERFAGFTGKKC